MGINVNLDQPRYDQGTYVGRAKHFFLTTNPLNVFATEAQLEDAKCLVDKFRNKQTLPSGTTEEDLWRAKTLYDSAFHPDTGEKMILIGRMSAQVPMNMIITGGMMAFYKSTPAVIFWQWFNQSFNALVNYTNRSGDASFTEKQIATSYVLATGGAVATALGLNRLCRNAPPLVGRLVPLAAVAAANCINIPMMRMQELQDGTPVYDEDNNKLGYSKNAAQSGIAQVIFSRVCMATPGMVLTPVLMNYLEKKGTLQRRPWINLPVQVGFVGLCLTFATPLACAFFKQKAQIAYKSLEPELKEQLDKKFGSRTPESTKELEEARCLYLKYRCGETLPNCLDEEDLWHAKALYESAFNHDAGTKIPFLVRPGTQTAMNAVLAGGLMAFYSSGFGVIFWHCLNQTYNAFVSSENKPGCDAFTEKQLVISYAFAAGTAVGTALTLNRMLRCYSPVVRRLAPLGAVAAAHCISVPLLKAQLLKNGAPIYDDCNIKLGYSKMAAQASISGVVFHKVANAVGPMVLTPFFIHHYVETRGTLCRYPWLNFPIHAALAFLFLTFTSPLFCACCEKKGLLPYKHLEPELQSFLCKRFYDRPPKYVQYDRSLS